MLHDRAYFSPAELFSDEGEGGTFEILNICFDALGGYVFAGMAHNKGMRCSGE